MLEETGTTVLHHRGVGAIGIEERVGVLRFAMNALSGRCRNAVTIPFGEHR
jgi:hypothetical protein